MSTEAVPSSGHAPETAPPPAETTTLPPSSPQMATPALSLGAIVGIVVAAAALFIAGAILFIVYWMRQERYKAEDERRYHPYLLRGASSMTTTHPHYTDDHKRRPSSILTAGWQAQSDELDRVMNMPRRARPRLEATYAGTSISSISGLPTHPAYIPRSAGLPGSNLRSMSSQASRSQRQTPSLNMTEKSQPAPVDESQHSPVLSDARTSIDSAEQPFSPLSKATTQRLSQRKTRAVDLPLRHVEPVEPAPVLAPRTSPHSYAMQQYLESTDDLPAQQPTRTRAALPPLDPKNLPPPPRHPPPAKVPSLALPSKPRLRAPLQYAPPRITGSSSPPGPPAVDSGYGDITISGPLVDMVTVDLSERRHRVSGLSHGHDQASRGLAPRSHIVAQTAHRHDDNEMPLHSGKSFLYG